MARVDKNSPFHGLRGRFGDMVIKRYGKKYVITRMPRFSGARSERQRQSEGKFRRASEYAERVRADPELRAVYAKWARHRSSAIRPTAIRDYMHAPKISGIARDRYEGKAGGRIHVVFPDAYKVIAVTVSLFGPGRRLIEKGPAIATKSVWIYTATKSVPDAAAVTLKVVARDRPGNRAVMRA